MWHRLAREYLSIINQSISESGSPHRGRWSCRIGAAVTGKVRPVVNVLADSAGTQRAVRAEGCLGCLLLGV